MYRVYNRRFFIYYCHDTQKGTLTKTTGKTPEHREEEGQPNRYRYHWNMEECWHYTFLTPEGAVLCEGDSPYAHGAHPYVFKLYPYVDGELHSFVADVIDQQRHVNRLITLYDWAMRSSAKGVLLFPEDCLVEGMTLEDVASQWSRFNGMLAIRTPPGKPLPQQISNNNTNIGIKELLNFQLKFFEDISGVNGALQGKPGYSNMSGTLYAQQTQNSTNSLLDILGAFSSFITDGAGKDVKNIQQFYRQKRVFNIAGRRATLREYDPDKLRNVDFDLSITENVATPAYRQAANEWLLQLHQQGVISTEQLLKAGAFPYADAILHP